MHRLIVTSARTGSRRRPGPTWPRRTRATCCSPGRSGCAFEAEIVRDAALSASGLLDRTIGGPSVEPPQPDGVYAFTQTAKKWTADTGPARYRRGDVHALLPQRAVSALHDVRRARFSNRLHAPRPQQHAAASADRRQRRGLPRNRPRPGGPRAARSARGRRDGSPSPRFLLALCREPSRSGAGRALQATTTGKLPIWPTTPTAPRRCSRPDLAKATDPPKPPRRWCCVSRAILNTDSFITRE